MISAITIALLAPEGESSGGLLSVDFGLAFWTVLIFTLLLIILKKFAWKPILTALDERESAIKESLEKAEKAKEEAQKILDQNQANLAKAEEESRKIIEQSRVYAQKLKDQLMQDSKEQAQKMIEGASQEIERMKQSAFDELKSQVAEIAVDAAEKLLREKLDKEVNKKIVDKYLKDITRN